MASLNYNHLRYFWVAAREGGLGRAAERLNLSASALSVQIQKLEHQLGQSLFERSGKRLALTEAGRMALSYADTVFQAGEEMVDALRGLPVQRRRPLRVGALPTLSRNFQLRFLRPLVARDDVELIVRTGPLRDLLAQLDALELDVVLSNAAVRRDARTPLRNLQIDRQPVSLVGRPRPGCPPFRFPDDLANESVLLPSLGGELRLAFDRVLERAGLRPNIRAEVDDMAMLRLLARESDGLTLVPPIVVKDELATGVLVEFCQIPEVSEAFYAIVPDRRYPNPFLAELLAAATR